MEGLEDRLQAHSAYFSSMVELIPASHYVVREEEEEEEDDQRMGKKKGRNRFWHNVKGSKEPVQKAKRKKMDSDRNGKSVDEESREEEGEADSVCREVRQKQFSVERVRSSTLSELHSRLHKKIEEFRSRRKCDEDGGRKHVAQRKQRAEEKKKRKDTVQREKEAKQRKAATAAGRGGGGGEGGQPPPTTSTQLSFSRFEFNTDSKPAKKKNYHVLVKRAEANQKKLEELKATDEEKGEQLQERQRWTRAVDMASGRKVKDDPKLLKRTLKRLDKRKKVSQRKWEERLQKEAEKKEGRQQKRRQNVQERTKLIKAKRDRKRAKKKGRL